MASLSADIFDESSISDVDSLLRFAHDADIWYSYVDGDEATEKDE
jgi:hypothetical protein